EVGALALQPRRASVQGRCPLDLRSVVGPTVGQMVGVRDGTLERVAVGTRQRCNAGTGEANHRPLCVAELARTAERFGARCFAFNVETPTLCLELGLFRAQAARLELETVRSTPERVRPRRSANRVVPRGRPQRAQL